MVRLTPIFLITGVGLILISAAGCKELPANARILSDDPPPGIDKKLDEGPSSITIQSGGEDTGEEQETLTDSTLYDFNDLAWKCLENNQFDSAYADLIFVPAPRWAVCDVHPSVSEGQDGMTFLPIDMRLYHTKNNGTTRLEDIRIMLPEPVDSASIVTANYDKPRANSVPLRIYASWLVAYDEEGNEIDRALNDTGGLNIVELVVRSAPDSSIHSLGIETYPRTTYLDNLKTWVSAGPPPDVTPPQFTYTVEVDRITVHNRKMVLAVSGIAAEDERGGPVALTVSVESNQEVIGPGNPTTPDWEFSDNGDGSLDVSLRAEYSDKDGDRIYSITLTGEDEAGNIAEETLQVVVARD